MKATDSLRGGVSQLWQHLTEGWQHLRDRAGRALTRFTDSAEREGGTGVARVSWGLLPVDLSESEHALIVELEVPGLDKADLEIEVDGRQLLIRGEKRCESVGRRGRYHIHECAYGSFQRVVPLPLPVDGDSAVASYQRGVLRVELSKQPGGGRRRVEIH
jgi:HSP20 family protein